MKVVNTGTHRLRHIWLAYVKATLAANPKYRRKDTGKYSSYHDIIIRKNVGDRWVIVMDYPKFKNIVEHLFTNAKTAVIQGEVFNLPHCGKVFIKRIQRDFRSKKKQVDWNSSIKKNPDFDEHGKRIFRKLIYFSGDDYLRIAWLKMQITNQSWYEFAPTAGDTRRQAGFKLELAIANHKDPILKYRYLFCPLKDIVKQIV